MPTAVIARPHSVTSAVVLLLLPMPSRPDLVRRLPRCIVGLAMFGAGIAAIVRADLGLAPWDVFHQGVSELTGISLGLVIVLTGVALLLLWIPLRQRAGIAWRELGLKVDLSDAVEPGALRARPELVK